MEIAGRETHPAADLFAMLAPDQLASLADDIKTNGLLEPITLLDGQILDGRNRLSACEQAEVEPEFTTYTGESPVAYVWSKNGVRRQLTKSQLSAVAAKILPELKEEARKRQVAGVKEPASNDLGSHGSQGADRRAPKATEVAGAIVGVSGSSVHRAAIVKEKNPTLFEKIESGEISVREAHRQVTEPDAPKATKKSRAIRVAEITKLAAEGFRSEQIAEQIGLGNARVRDIALKEGITLPDSGIRNTRRINSYRVIEETVHTLSGCALGLSTIDGTKLDIGEIDAAEWGEQITLALRPINKLRKQLKEIANGVS